MYLQLYFDDQKAVDDRLAFNKMNVHKMNILCIDKVSPKYKWGL